MSFVLLITLILTSILQQVYDNYAGNNGTKWQLCKFQHFKKSDEQDDGISNKEDSQEISMRMMKRDVEKRYSGGGGERQHPPFIIISYLNTLHIRQKTTSESNINLNATIRIQQGELAWHITLFPLHTPRLSSMSS